jgi:hypothetical protein
MCALRLGLSAFGAALNSASVEQRTSFALHDGTKSDQFIDARPGGPAERNQVFVAQCDSRLFRGCVGMVDDDDGGQALHGVCQS